MQIEPKLAHISMIPGDALKINVGISYKCDIVIMSNGKLRIYHSDSDSDSDGESLEL